MKIKLPLTLRLLLFNVLVLFLPIATLLYLDTYERQLLTMQERSMVQQGRILSAALKDRELTDADRIIQNLEQRSEARIRILNSEGHLVTDSAVAYAEKEEDQILSTRSEEDRALDQEVRGNLLYKLFGWLYQTYKKMFLPPDPSFASGKYYSGKENLLGQEVQAALLGRYGAVTRVSTGDQRSVNLYSALPVFYGEEVSGVILVSQSTYKILEDLYKLRLDIIRIFSLSLMISLIVSLLLSLQITRPIVKLSRKAGEVLDPHGKFLGHFPVFKRRDELGDLSRSLQQLSKRLEKKIRFIDSMTADLVHELKNPLSSLTSSLDLVTFDKKDVSFKTSMKGQISRMDGLLNQMREVTGIEQQMDQEEREILNMRNFFPLLLDMNAAWLKDRVELNYLDKKPFILSARGDRISQVLVNLLDNALSFTPEGEKVQLCVDGAKRSLSVIDRGPGIPEGNHARLFDRFFSDRENRENHSGLGLAIVQAIMHGYGGSVEYKDTPGGGSTFILHFPLNKS